MKKLNFSQQAALGVYLKVLKQETALLKQGNRLSRIYLHLVLTFIYDQEVCLILLENSLFPYFHSKYFEISIIKIGLEITEELP